MDWFRRARGRPRHPDVLTPAEWRVLELVREGRSNPEIAARLGVSVNTVRAQVSSMLAKLDLAGRRELAAWQGEPVEASRAALRRFPGAGILGWLRGTASSVAASKASLVAVLAVLSIVGGVAVSSLNSAGEDPGAAATPPATATVEDSETGRPDQPPPPERKRVEPLEEPVVATADGVEIRVDGVRYSGTETLLSGHLVHGHASSPGAFADAEIAFVPGSDGAVARLPPIVVREGYEGIVTLVIEMDGQQWELALPGPDPASVHDTLRVEEFDEETLDVEGRTVTVSGRRSTSETVIEVRGRTLLVVPELILEDGRIWPYFAQDRLVQIDGFEGTDAWFPPTPFGEPVRVDLRAMQVFDAEETLRVTVDVGRVLARAPDGPASHGEFRVQAWEVHEGEPAAVVSVTRGAHHGPLREWVGLRVRGSWYIDPTRDAMLDGHGSELRLSGSMVGYSRDGDGNISPGETEVQAFIRRPEDIDRITLILGGADAVSRGPHVVTLWPQQ